MSIQECLIGAGSILEGTFVCEGLVRIEGECKGKITSTGTIVVAESALVDGELTAREVHVSGTVLGSIAANKLVSLSPPARVRATIVSARFKLETGARFSGSVTRRSS